MKRILLVAILMVACIGSASAQSKWSYKLGFGGAYKSGNVNSMTITNNGGIDRNDSLLAFSADYSIVYGEKDQVMYDKGLTASMKFDIWQYDRWSPFVSASYINNKFKGYEYKNSFLAGVKYRIYWNKMCDYSVSAAYVFDYVEYVKGATLDPQVSRVSMRFKMRQKITDAVTLKHTTFYQPSLKDFGGDYIVTSITSLDTKLTSHLTFGINFNYEYRSLVPDGIQKQDIATTASLNLTF